MDSCKNDKLCFLRNNLRCFKVASKAVVSARYNKEHVPTSMKWLTVISLIGLIMMFLLIFWQHLQISAMQLQLDNLLYEGENRQFEHSHMGEELKNTENETHEGVISRLRRQARSSTTQNSRPFPFAYLTGIGNQPGENHPYVWTPPPSSNDQTSMNSYVSNVHLHYGSNANAELVEAIQVPCRGWFYVYAQIPYRYNNSKQLIGHKIVKVSNCSNGPSLPVLQTVVQLPIHSTGTKTEDWKYLGGIVHLAGGDHVQVVASLSAKTGWLNSNPIGGFFGLYLIKEEQGNKCRLCQ